MGSHTSCLRHSNPKSAEPDIKSKSFKRPSSANQTRRYKEKEHHKTLLMQKKSMIMSTDSLTLEDCLLLPPAGFKSPRKKVHPSSSRQVRRRLISEAQDSLCLDRPVTHNKYRKQEEEGKSECLSVISGKEKGKRVRFKLPHVVILYSPEEEAHGGYCNSSTEDYSFCLSLEGNCRGGSFESEDELCVRLAVNTLPQASFSSGL